MAADKQDNPKSGSGTEKTGATLLQARYQIVRSLGEGGMGKIFMAHDRHLHDRPCVIKKLKEDFYHEKDQQGALVFFEREARTLSQLQHPNVVQVTDYFEEDRNYYLVMEYIEGKDLQQVMAEQQKPLHETQVVDWAIQICGVLEYLHRHTPPVMYRDLKPSNIMIDVNGVLKLVDFGIARAYEGRGEKTAIVSAGYSPPEQYRGESEPRSDIYALGATMHFLLTCVEPSTLRPARPRSINPQISEALNTIVQTATAQDPDLRFQTATAMNQALLAAAQPRVVSIFPSWSRLALTVLALVIGLSAVGYEVIQVMSGKQVDRLISAPEAGAHNHAMEEEADLTDPEAFGQPVTNRDNASVH